jgi:hypothetical protein
MGEDYSSIRTNIAGYLGQGLARGSPRWTTAEFLGQLGSLEKFLQRLEGTEVARTAELRRGQQYPSKSLLDSPRSRAGLLFWFLAHYWGSRLKSQVRNAL